MAYTYTTHSKKYLHTYKYPTYYLHSMLYSNVLQFYLCCTSNMYWRRESHNWTVAFSLLFEGQYETIFKTVLAMYVPAPRPTTTNLGTSTCTFHDTPLHTCKNTFQLQRLFSNFKIAVPWTTVNTRMSFMCLWQNNA